LYQVGDYLFNTKLAQIITPCGTTKDLTPIAFHLLTYLVENNDRLINKRELILKVWKHEVSDSSINKTISQLRAIFKDCPQAPSYILTRRKLGYRLIAETKGLPAGVSIKGGKYTALNNAEVKLF